MAGSRLFRGAVLLVVIFWLTITALFLPIQLSERGECFENAENDTLHVSPGMTSDTADLNHSDGYAYVSVYPDYNSDRCDFHRLNESERESVAGQSVSVDGDTVIVGGDRVPPDESWRTKTFEFLDLAQPWTVSYRKVVLHNHGRVQYERNTWTDNRFELDNEPVVVTGSVRIDSWINPVTVIVYLLSVLDLLYLVATGIALSVDNFREGLRSRR